MDKDLKQQFSKNPKTPIERVDSKLYELANSQEVEFDTHCHFFNHQHIPEKYFRLRFPLHSKKFLDQTERFFDMLNPFTGEDKMSYYAYFLNFIERKSIEIADYFIGIHSPDTIFCPLLVNMEYGIAGKAAPFSQQIDEMVEIRKKYPRQILPFIGIDPNSPTAKADFLRAFTPEQGFFGVKVYPALGFLPSHPVLMDIFDICEERKIPVVTHSGGDSVHATEKIIENTFLDYNSKGDLVRKIETVRFRSAASYGKYYNSPARWEAVLKTFPNLRLNFGHFGGGSNWKKLKNNNFDNKVLRIIDLMHRYPNVYSDVSFLMSDVEFFDIFIKFYNKNKILQERTLFGSDFFMVVTEGKYKNMRTNFRMNVGDEIFKTLAQKNPKKFLFDL